MDIGAVGGGSPNPLEPLPRTTVASGVPVPAANVDTGEDRIASSLQGLASPQIRDLLGLIEQTRLAPDPALLDGLLRAAVAAVGTHRPEAAMKAVAELFSLNPGHAAQLVSQEPSLAPIRDQIESLSRRVTFGAKVAAEQAFSTASLAIDNAASPARLMAGLDPRDVLAVAQHLIESGQPNNLVRAAELSQTVLAYVTVPVFDARITSVRGSKPRQRSRSFQAGKRLKAIWQRAPLLLLLAGWFSVGLVGGIISLIGRYSGRGPLSPVAVGIWVIGFLAMVLFQFIVTLRNARF
jgi:hypothetical protein